MRNNFLSGWIVVALAFCIGSLPVSAEEPSYELASASDPFALSLTQLMNAEISHFTLTPTVRRIEPGITTLLEEYLIEYSGARTSDELQEMLVPNAQLFRKERMGNVLGYRGINTEADLQYLTLVNGKRMNSRQDIGTAVERRIPLMGDLRRVEVLRGPGSVMHGQGALSSVTNLETHSGLTFEGGDVRARYIFLDELATAETRYGHQFNDDSGLFVYAGVADREGADEEASPVYWVSDFTTGTRETVRGGEKDSLGYPNDHQSDGLMAKAHADMTAGDWRIWARYLRYSETTLPTSSSAGNGRPTPPDAGPDPESSVILRKGLTNNTEMFTASVGWEGELSDDIKGSARMSYDWSSLEYFRPTISGAEAGEFRDAQDLNARMTLSWSPSSNHQIGIGGEGYYDWYESERQSPGGVPGGGGPPGGGPPAGGPPPGRAPVQDNTKTEVLTFGPLFEYQWRIAESLTTFLGIRGDKTDADEISDWAWSPRAAVILSPTDSDTIKLIYSRSVLIPSGLVSSFTPEKLWVGELRYLHSFTDAFECEGGVFYQRLKDPIADANGNVGPRTVGTFDIGGIELEMRYKSGWTTVYFSHSYTDLMEAELANGIDYTVVTVEPNGYGDDLATWSNHLTKIMVVNEIGAHWIVNGSAAVYWGFQGMRDWVEFNSQLEPNPSSFSGVDQGNDEGYGPSAYVNLGLQHNPVESLELRLDLYNVLGWLDEDLNKRNFQTFELGSYRVESPAVGISGRFHF